MNARQPLRLAILWPCWTGYLDAGLAALFDLYDLQALLVQEEPDPEAPFDVMALPAASRCKHARYEEGYEALSAKLEAFRPDLILVCSWAHPTYRRLCRSWAGRAPRVMHMDNQWQGTLKQWAGVMISPFFVRRLIDHPFVPGGRQAQFARRLGFGDDAILWPSLTGDVPAFAPAAATPLAERRAFLFVGRLAPEKGLDVLADAYAAYRAQTDAPWPLIVCGTGRLAKALEGQPGIDLRGFVQPADLPAEFARAACLVLPSTYEPYAVVLHEAALAGQAIICTEAVAAGDDFVDNEERNGIVVPTGDAASLTAALLRIGALDDAALAKVQAVSQDLADRRSPQSWAMALTSPIRNAAHNPLPAAA